MVTPAARRHSQSDEALRYTSNMVQIATLTVGLAVGFMAILGAALGILTYGAP